MDWFSFLKNAPYSKEELKMFVVKGKITREQYTQITGELY